MIFKSLLIWIKPSFKVPFTLEANYYACSIEHYHAENECPAGILLEMKVTININFFNFNLLIIDVVLLYMTCSF